MTSKAFEYTLEIYGTPFGAQKWIVDSVNSRIKRSLTLKAKALICVALAVTALITVVLVLCFSYVPSKEFSYWPSHVSQSRLGAYRVAAVSTDTAICAPIGRNILQRNGSAVDTAIAVLTCMGAVHPQSSGLGGGFLMLVYKKKEGRVYFIDARETAPSRATRELYEDKQVSSEEGGMSIAIPGELPGFVVAHEKFGSLPWEELFKPTIDLCRKGFPVSFHLSRALHSNRVKKLNITDVRERFFNNETGELYKEGEIIKCETLSRTLEVIAKRKMQALYGPGDTAMGFLRDIMSSGSLITRLDMQGYAPKYRKPVQIQLKNNMTLYSVSLPGSGPLLAFMLNVLDGYPDINETVPTDKKAAVLTYHRLVETFKYAYAKRSLLEDEESKEMEHLVELLTSKDYADEIRSHISDVQTFDDPDHYGANFTAVDDHGTAHMAVIAPNGDAVSVTSTVNLYFGSGVYSSSTGIFLNDEMDDFSTSKKNAFDLPPTAKNTVKPGRRPMSSMCPAIVVDMDGNVRLAIGGNGGSMITSAVAQVMARNLLLGEDIKQSIDAPRLHHQLTPNFIQYEKDFPKEMLKELEKFGHKVQGWAAEMMAIVMGIARTEDGVLQANSDARKGGDVDGF